VIACRLPPFDARSINTHEVLASLVASELYTWVRDQAGAAYSVDGRAVALRGGAAHMAIRMDVDDTRLRQVLAVVRARWARLASGEFDRGALSQIKWHMSTAAGLQFQTSTELAMRAVETLNLGLKIDAVDGLGRDLPAIDVSDLTAPFRTCAGTTVISLIGDSAKIRAAL
jgi:predicted Zn-dependent peptidase